MKCTKEICTGKIRCSIDLDGPISSYYYNRKDIDITYTCNKCGIEIYRLFLPDTVLSLENWINEKLEELS